MPLKKLTQHPALLLLLGVIIIGLIYFKPSIFSLQTANTNQFQLQFQQKEKKVTHLLLALKKQQATQLNLFTKYENLFEKEGIALFLLQNNKPLQWSERSISLPQNLEKLLLPSGMLLLENGWYYYQIEKEKNKTFLALMLIKNEFSITNSYLKNTFHHSFNFENTFDISLEKGTYAIENNENKPIFYLSQQKETPNGFHENNWLLLVLYLISVLCIVGFLVQSFKKHSFLHKYNYLFILAFLVLIRIINMTLKFPTSIFSQEIFSPLIYAHSWLFPSLGDFLLHIFSFFIAVYVLIKYKNNISAKNKIAALFFMLITVALPLLIANLQEGLVKNSKINFDINYVLDLSSYSFVGIGAMLLLYISVIVLIKAIIYRFTDAAFSSKKITVIFIAFAVASILVGYFVFSISIMANLWLLITIFILSFKHTSKKVEFNKIILLTLIIATTIAYGFITFSAEKEVFNKKFIAKKLAKEQDPITEYLFKELKTKMEVDTLLQNNLNNYWNKKNELDNYIVKKYFGGFWNNYLINITKCNIYDTLFIEDTQKNMFCLDFFNEKIKKEAFNAFNIDEDINFLYSDNGVSSYLGKFTINDSSNRKENTSLLFLELFPKSYSQAIGYPELLLDEKEIEKSIHLKNYSFAKYKKGKLSNSSNNLNYETELTSKYTVPEVYQFLAQTTTNFEHLVYQADKFTTIVLSARKKTMVNYITTFSYLFLIASLVLFLVSVFFKLPPFNWQVSFADFSSKIQLFIISSILLSFLLYGWGTTYYIEKQYVNKNKKILSEKMQSLIIELEEKFGEHQTLSSANIDEMSYYLVKFSNVFYTDINLFDKTGNLITSSRPEIYEAGLISNRMNPVAFKKMNLDKKVGYINNEEIGNLEYLSSYVAFYSKQNKFLAYVNLPYFAKQDEFENELSEFFTSLINIYGLLFLISVIIAVFLGNYIAEPLRLIKDKISALSFGKSYETITWKSNDEIGALVKEYNKKVVELEENALKLAKSERESAWREMAKQVAHEIKNPLTPMKLSIQHLQRSSDDNQTSIKEKINKTATTLIEQIDTLTNIANAFSNFAEMPKTNAVQVDVLPIIATAIHLFNENDSIHKVSPISLHTSLQTMYVVADKDQLSRLFTNLIKNALQAIDAVKRDGKIEIIVTKKTTHYLVEIKDNGEGISNDKKDKIFVPNFTTKNTGMGLGLAMVKNIVENMNGKIYFESTANVGTTFFIEIPKVY